MCCAEIQDLSLGLYPSQSARYWSPLRVDRSESGDKPHTPEHHRRAVEEVEADELGPKYSHTPTSPWTHGRWGGPIWDMMTLRIWKGPISGGSSHMERRQLPGLYPKRQVPGGESHVLTDLGNCRSGITTHGMQKGCQAWAHVHLHWQM